MVSELRKAFRKLSIVFLFVSTPVFAVQNSFTFSGNLSGTAANPNIQLTVFSGACNLYTQSYSSVQLDANGNFSLNIDGSGTFLNVANTTLQQIFDTKNVNILGQGACSVNGSTASWAISATVNLNPLSGSVPINAVPFAMTAQNAEKIGGQNVSNSTPIANDTMQFIGSTWTPVNPATARANLGLGSLAMMSPIGIADSTTYLRGDNTWVAISSGISSLNGLSGSTQTFATGTTGTDFNISSVGSIHTFNLPTASALNRGALNSSDWSSFNNKLGPSTAFLGDISGVYNAISVDKLKGRTISSVLPSLGSILKWNDLGSQWEPFVMPSCTSANSILHYNSITDTWSCDLASIASAQVNDATDASVGNAIVKRNASGDFSANQINANLIQVSTGGAAVCDTNVANGGKLRYNSSTGKMEYCNHIVGSWQALSNGVSICDGMPSVGTACPEGTIFAGTFNYMGENGLGVKKLMVTPGNCTNSVTPTCNGAIDTLYLTWGSTGLSHAGATWPKDGAANTTYLAANYSDTYAAKYCENMSYGGYTDWYLPSGDELQYLMTQSVAITGFIGTYYWASTQDPGSPTTQAIQYTPAGAYGPYTKTSSYPVRCIRRY